MIFKREEKERGASVTAVVVMIALVTIVGVVFSSLLTTGVEEATGEVTSTRALYAAEAGRETAIGRLKKAPVTTNWTWNDGYSAKAFAGGTVDVEILQYESRDGTLAGTSACEPFESSIEATGANPARTVYIVLAWDTAGDMDLELYDSAVADCGDPLASANLIASSAATDSPEIIRYPITDAAPATVTYTARVTGTSGDAFTLRISHPDETGFSAGNTCGAPDGVPLDECARAIISLGRHGGSVREVFAGLERNP